MKITYDAQAQAAYIQLNDQSPHRAISMGEYVVVHVDEANKPVAIELLWMGDYVTEPSLASVIDLLDETAP